MSDSTETATFSSPSGLPIAIDDGPPAPNPLQEMLANHANELVLEERYHVARDRVIQQFEKLYLLRLMNRTRGNLTEAARIAAVNRTTLYRMMERNGLQRAPSYGWLTEVDGKRA